MKAGHVLVIDDEKSQRDILTVILEGEGYSVETASSQSTRRTRRCHRTGRRLKTAAKACVSTTAEYRPHGRDDSSREGRRYISGRAE